MNSDLDPKARNGRIACALHNDTRLVAGAVALVAHVARRSGFSERAEADLTAAAAEACRETLLWPSRQAGPSCLIELMVSDFPDRVEVTIESSAREAPAAGHLGPRAGAAPKAVEGIGRPVEGDLVDRVVRETREGRSRVTLVKYCNAAKSRPRA